MQLSLQLITVYAFLSFASLSVAHRFFSGNEAILANQMSGVDALRVEVQRLTRLFRARTQQPVDQTNTQVIRNLQQRVESAGQFVSSASTVVNSRTIIAGGSKTGIAMSEQQRTRITNWIPLAASTVDEEDDHDTYATSSTFSQMGPFTDDTVTAYHDAQTTGTSMGGRTEWPSDGQDPDIVKHLIQHWKKSAKSKFNAEEYAAAEKCLRKVITRSEAIFGQRFKGRDEILKMLAMALSRQCKWNEAYLLLQ